MQNFPDSPVFPHAANLAAAARLHEDFSALGPIEQKFAQSPEGQALLDCLGGNAPYLAGLACQEPACLLATMATGPDRNFAAMLADLQSLKPDTSRSRISAALRQAKRRAALAIAIADLGGLWPLPKITDSLSELAETTLRVAIRHLLFSLHETGKMFLPYPDNPERDSGFVALALGKLGARELNYSSDIDLVLLFDPESPANCADAQAIMARFARDLITLLSQRDEEGYVFRVDLRLRPDPAATPPAVSLPMALSYYESQGRTWERAAFSKARPVAGDIALGENFLAAIRPFIWRKHLDFAAINDIHDMKRKIDARFEGESLPGLDIKLGHGGIREIEFVVQTLGLVWGGQDSTLRIPGTLQALPALAKAGHLPEAAARELAADYRQLRRVEHRLQMVDDRQTHTLPATPEALAAFAVFLDDSHFLRDFPKLLARVHAHFLAFFDAGGEQAQQCQIDPGHDGPPPAAFVAYLQRLSFTGVQHIAERLRAWTNGEVPALRSDRARVLLGSILPHLLAALGQQPDPDKAFAHFDTLLLRQRAGVQLLSLFQHNPALLQRLAAVLGAAPALAEHLAQDAYALEALLVPSARFATPKPVLRRMLREAADFEDAVAITRRFVRREEFHLSVATLEGRMNINEAGRLRSELAATALSVLLPLVMAQHQARYGRIRRGAFAVVALGKAGSSEMLAGSDLDLMLIYDHAATPTAPVPYFVRLSHGLTTALTALGPEGPLYKVDMRLRPSGNQGPVAVSLAAFSRYQAQESWTWERLALTHARVLAATSRFAPVVQRAILEALCRSDPPEKIRRDTVAMRDRLNREMPPRGPFDVKHLPGGMFELAFIAGALQLIHGPPQPDLFRPNTAAALRGLAEAGHLAAQDAQALIGADFLWRSIQGIDRLTGLGQAPAEPPAAMLNPLLRATSTPDLTSLRHTMAKASLAVQDCFERYIHQGVSE